MVCGPFSEREHHVIAVLIAKLHTNAVWMRAKQQKMWAWVKLDQNTTKSC
jgi:hypothetical protein